MSWGINIKVDTQSCSAHFSSVCNQVMFNIEAAFLPVYAALRSGMHEGRRWQAEAWVADVAIYAAVLASRGGDPGNTRR